MTKIVANISSYIRDGLAYEKALNKTINDICFWLNDEKNSKWIHEKIL